MGCVEYVCLLVVTGPDGRWVVLNMYVCQLMLLDMMDDGLC